jgi:hypothetical protein
VKLLTHNTSFSEALINNNDFYPYFKDCLGAIDETHIPTFIPED